MSETPHAAIAELMPHDGPMRLLDRVLSHDAGHTACAVRPAASALFAGPDGRLPSWLAIEWIAQCAAAHGGLVGRAHGEPPRTGFLVGARKVVLHVPSFDGDEELVVRVERGRDASGLFDFAGRVTRLGDETPLVEGRVQCFVQESAEAFRRMGWK
jgi:predicted hotdog family 3-hydroxylacyl-ACP dehydratase